MRPFLVATSAVVLLSACHKQASTPPVEKPTAGATPQAVAAPAQSAAKKRTPIPASEPAGANAAAKAGDPADDIAPDAVKLDNLSQPLVVPEPKTKQPKAQPKPEKEP